MLDYPVPLTIAELWNKRVASEWVCSSYCCRYIVDRLLGIVGPSVGQINEDPGDRCVRGNFVWRMARYEYCN